MCIGNSCRTRVQVTKVEGEEEAESPKTERLGRVYLHRLGLGEQGEVLLQEVARRECRAVLDMKWQPGGSLPRLGVCDAGGALNVYVAGEGGLQSEGEVTVSPGLALALDWGPGGQGAAVSDSRGAVHVLQRDTAGQLVVSRSYPGHQYEAWTVAFSRHDSNLLFSGGDDCCLHMYDLRLEQDSPVRKNSREHGMGVTSLLGSSHEDHLVWTGSYDERVRSWDTRNLKSPLCSVAVGGGVWRIKQQGDKLLVAAMHDGFKILEGEKVVAEYRGHESLAYGADWVPGVEGVTVGGREADTVATCSFYDHLLKVWSVQR